MNTVGNSYFLPVLILLPLIGALVLTLAKGMPARTAKATALGFTLAELVVTVFLWVDYRSFLQAGTGEAFGAWFSVEWIPAFGINLSLGVDGTALVMIALIAILVPIVLGASWDEKLPQGRTAAGYFALILTLQGTMVGVFAAADVLVFYFLFEIMLIPMYFLIGAYGGVRRAYAATKFFLYSLLGGLLMLASVIGLYVASAGILPDGGTLDWATLRSIADQIPESTQLWIFGGFFAAFAIKAPLVPLHTWLPDAGSEAPIGAGTLLVGVLDKVGTFGFLRICLPLLPVASAKLAWLVILMAVLGVMYGAIVAAGQTDLKRFVTYTSIAHFGFIALGVFAFTTQSISGAILYMVNHGLATGLIFLTIGMLTARGGSKLIGDYGGVWKVAPLLGGLFFVGAMATVSLPGTNSFVSEFLVLLGTYSRYPAWAIVATVGIVLAAVYMLWIFQRVFTGPVRGSAVVHPSGPSDVDHGPQRPGSGHTGEEPADLVTAAHDQLEEAGGTATGGAGTGTGIGTATATATRTHRHGARFGDLNAREIGVLTPLVILILVLGVYPKPVLDVINPTAERIVTDSGHVDPAPRVDVLGGGDR